MAAPLDGVGACETSGVTICAGNGLGTVCNAVPGNPASPYSVSATNAAAFYRLRR